MDDPTTIYYYYYYNYRVTLLKQLNETPQLLQNIFFAIAITLTAWWKINKLKKITMSYTTQTLFGTIRTLLQINDH